MYTVPASPMYSEGQQTDLSERGGGVGVTFDGGFVYSAYGGPTYGQVVDFGTSAPRVEGDTFDACGGHSSSATEASYHYHVPPVCLLHQLRAAEGAPSPQVGWMLDGFPIYGPLGPGGTAMKTCTVTGGTFGVDDCTDDCGGYYGDTGDGFMYRYYFLGEYNDGTCCTAPIDPQDGGGADYYPFTPACMSGCCPSGAWCSFGLPACDGDAIDGTTASFSPIAIGALATNTEACANDDVCCDFDVNSETCKVVTGSSTGASCGACTYSFPAAGPSPTLSPVAGPAAPAPVPEPTGSPVVAHTPTPSPVAGPAPPAPVSGPTASPTGSVETASPTGGGDDATRSPTGEPSAAPSAAPVVTASVSVHLEGVASCAVFGDAERAAFVAAVVASAPSLDDASAIGEIECADEARRRAARRRPLADAVGLSFDVSVSVEGASAIGSGAELAEALEAELDDAVSSGTFDDELHAGAVEAGSAVLTAAVATGVVVATLAPTEAPTEAPSVRTTFAPTLEPEEEDKETAASLMLMLIIGGFIAVLSCCCALVLVGFMNSRKSQKPAARARMELAARTTDPSDDLSFRAGTVAPVRKPPRTTAALV